MKLLLFFMFIRVFIFTCWID